MQLGVGLALGLKLPAPSCKREGGREERRGVARRVSKAANEEGREREDKKTRIHFHAP